MLLTVSGLFPKGYVRVMHYLMFMIIELQNRRSNKKLQGYHLSAS